MQISFPRQRIAILAAWRTSQQGDDFLQHLRRNVFHRSFVRLDALLLSPIFMGIQHKI